MEKPAVTRLRAELVAALTANADRLRQAIGAELAKPIALEADRRLQFEIDPWFFGVTLCAMEEIILPGDWLDSALPGDWFERAEDAEINWDALIAEELCPWFAECWQSVGGPAAFSPAYLFFHDYHGQQYHLEGRRWISVAEAFGKSV
jgi:hypothetical protein